MATIKEAMAVDISGYEPIERPSQVNIPPVDKNLEPRYNSMLRCPLPPVSVTPDSLRQFYLGGQIPQTRLLTPLVQTNSGSGTTNQTTIVTSTSTATSSSSTTVNLAIKSSSVTTPALVPNGQFTTTILVAKSFQLIGIAADAICRVQFYGTASAQLLDLGRALDSAPPFGTMQNLISDIVLDIAPLSWTYQNRVGANGDSPQGQSVYVTITNVDPSNVTPVSVTFSYIPLES